MVSIVRFGIDRYGAELCGDKVYVIGTKNIRELIWIMNEWIMCRACIK